TFFVVSSPSHGTLSGTAPNLTYTSFGFVGTDSFTYAVSDGFAFSKPATVTITVKHGLLINNISVTEGNSGFTAAAFTVSITGPYVGPSDPGISYSLHTIDGTATAADMDYVAISGLQVTFPTSN